VGGCVRAAVSAVSHCLAVGWRTLRPGREGDVGERDCGAAGAVCANVGVFLDKRLTSSNNQ